MVNIEKAKELGKQEWEPFKLFDTSLSDFITEKRFGTDIFCPRCNSLKVRKNGFNKTMQRFFCADCNKSFSASTNTITHSSKKTFGKN